MSCKTSPPALIACGGLDPSNIVLNCTAMFDKYIEKGAPASYYALSTGTHVRVGSGHRKGQCRLAGGAPGRQPAADFPEEARKP